MPSEGFPQLPAGDETPGLLTLEASKVLGPDTALSSVFGSFAAFLSRRTARARRRQRLAPRMRRIGGLKPAAG